MIVKHDRGPTTIELQQSYTHNKSQQIRPNTISNNVCGQPTLCDP